MKIFLSASYSSKVDSASGRVSSEYRDFLEKIITSVESHGHQTFCSLRADDYMINHADPADSFRTDMDEIKKCDALLAVLGETPSTGVQTEIGFAAALKKKIIFLHDSKVPLAYFNAAMVKAGVAKDLFLPIDASVLIHAIQSVQ